MIDCVQMVKALKINKKQPKVRDDLFNKISELLNQFDGYEFKDGILEFYIAENDHGEEYAALRPKSVNSISPVLAARTEFGNVYVSYKSAPSNCRFCGLDTAALTFDSFIKFLVSRISEL